MGERRRRTEIEDELSKREEDLREDQEKEKNKMELVEDNQDISPWNTTPSREENLKPAAKESTSDSGSQPENSESLETC